MRRSELAAGRLYELIEDYYGCPKGTKFLLSTDDGTSMPMFKQTLKKGDPGFVGNESLFVELSFLRPVKKHKMAKTKKSDCETCATPKKGGCRCGLYGKASTSTGRKFDNGDGIKNINPVGPNTGKVGVVVDYNKSTNEYAIAYSDGETGVGGPENYEALHKSKGFFFPIPTEQLNRAVADLALHVGVATTATKSNKKFKPKFKLGDKVLVGERGLDGLTELRGRKGVVKHIDESLMSTKSTYVGVDLGPTYSGHNLGGAISTSTGRYGYDNEMALYVEVKKEVNEEALASLVLESSVKKEIIAVLKQHDNRDKLFDEWGLGETIEYGRGMSLMFWGGPGTGKTWGAHCIAKALGKELLVISAAEVQSSEPGATERNIQAAFQAATEGEKVLFLDECDSLITTRADLGMVLAAQVNCLLTSIEKFEGVCILATNRIQTMDEALERRIALIVEFPFPKYAQRIQIWQKLLPSKLPLAEGVTPEVLAQPKFTGGQIKNIILQAARLALAEESKQVEKEHFDQAIERVKKSKGIMGQVARSHTGRPGSDMYVGVGSNPQIGRGVDTDMSVFLDEDDEIDKDKK